MVVRFGAVDVGVRRAALGGGVLGITAVLAGAANQIPGFSPRSGCWGTPRWIEDFLYGVGSDLFALSVVSVMWFIYRSQKGIADAY